VSVKKGGASRSQSTQEFWQSPGLNFDQIFITPGDVLEAVSKDANVAAIQLAVDLTEDFDKLLVEDEQTDQ